MTRVPLLSGSRVAVVSAPEGAVVLRPPPPGEGIADVAAAVVDALRYPLSGRPLEELVTRGGRATVVVEPPSLPIPGSARDPRQAAVAAAIEELDRLGVPVERQTILVAGGLARRLVGRAAGGLVSPEFARRFHGRLEVHDVEAPDLVELGSPPLRIHRALVETDLVVPVSAAETVLHGGPGMLLGAAGAETLAGERAFSLVETRGSSGWDEGLRLERALAARVPMIGVSLALNHPELGAFRGYPYNPGSLERVARSPLRRGFGLLPGAVRSRVLHSLRCELSAAAVFAGPPAVAHAEALLRAVETRSAPLDRPLDTLCIGIPPSSPHLPRERPNPLLAAYLGLGLALRLWRDAPPVVEGGSLIILHRFHRHFAHPTQQPYRVFFGATRHGPDPELLDRAAREAAVEPKALEAYREGRGCHPLLPFADWAACQPALGRLGAVLVAGCRDATAARQLGFVPTHAVGAALDMARGRAGGEGRLGFLLSPPYFPLRVGED